MLRFCIYQNKEAEWPFGTGFEIALLNRSEPLWYTMINDDFGPHSVQLIDLDSDGRSDLFFFVGLEDVFSTFIYKANYESGFSSPFDANNFQLIFSNDNDYAVLIKPRGATDPG